MQRMTHMEQTRLSEEIESLDQKISSAGVPEGLRERCASSFLKQLRKHKSDKLAELRAHAAKSSSRHA